MSQNYSPTLGPWSYLNDVIDTYPGAGSNAELAGQYPGMLGQEIYLSHDEAIALTNVSATDYTSATPLRAGWYKYVQMATSPTITPARGLAVYWKAATDQATYVVTTDAPTGGTQFAGTLINALTSGKYGWIQIKGLHTVKGKASALTNTGAVGQRLSIVSAAGTWDNAAAGNTSLAGGAGVQTLAFFLDLATLANGDTLTDYVPGFAFKILSVDFRVHKAVTTAAKAASINLEIGSTNLTGGVVALTSANCTPAGAAVAGSAVTAANVGSATDTLSIEASSVTAFVEGNGWLLVKVQNLDTADALSGAESGGAIAYEALTAGGLKLAYIYNTVPNIKAGLQ